MAGKSQTPKPPRPVQAPKQRSAPRSTDERRTWRALIVIGALGFVGLAVALGFVLFGGSGSAQALSDAGCAVQTFKAQGQQHVQELPKGFKYNSFPPTSGPHNPVPAPFDFYDEPVEELRLVHNLEHGGVVVQYGRGVPADQVEELRAWWRSDPDGIVVASLPALGQTISFAAWTADYQGNDPTPRNQQGVLAKCPRFERDAAEAFVDRYGFRGPERFDRIMLAPGS
jgi:hypothetical protein